jgi:hypothetical protein
MYRGVLSLVIFIYMTCIWILRNWLALEDGLD